MPHPLPTDPEILAFIAKSDAFYPADAASLPMAENRRFYDRFAEELQGPVPEGVSWKDFTIQGPSEIRVRRYSAAEPKFGTVLYLHGGGFVLGGLESHHDACLGICDLTKLDVVAVDYRLAPEHKHPAQIDDCDTVFAYLALEKRPIIVAGDSAGGNLAAALCLRYRTKPEGQWIKGQVLIYPGLGGNTEKGSYLENAEAPMLTTADCLAYASFRSGYDQKGHSANADLAPLSAEDVTGLPPAYIFSADIDPLRDDARDYAAKLAAARVSSVWRNEPQLVHGYIRARHMSARAASSFKAICRAMSYFSGTLQP